METEVKIVHRLKVKIYYEDTDAVGVVYYANYLRYFERARTEFLLTQGVDVTEYHEKGYFFPVVHIDVHYRQPARLGDTIEVTTEVTEITNATILLKQQALKGETLIVDSFVRLACIDKNSKPQRLPDDVRRLRNYGN